MADPQVAAIVAELERLAERIVTKITFDVVANLVEATPVDTGWARANWIPSATTPSAFGATARGSPSSANSAREAGLAAVARYTLAQGNVFIANNVPYILSLNDGRSTQAAANFVQDSVAQATSPRALAGIGG